MIYIEKTTVGWASLIVAIVVMIPIGPIMAQGCSDAGFCTINSFKPVNDDTVHQTKNQIRIGASYGSADYSIGVFGNYVEYNHQFQNNLGVDVKITSLAQQGNGISVFGFSDIYLSGNYKVNQKLKLTLGAKVPLSKSDKTLRGLPLPMDYQSSLGTFDLITGVGYEFGSVQVVVALQQPLTQNDNQFFAEDYPNDSRLMDFQSTNQFKRSGDILLRVSYPVAVGERLKITPSILPIYHLSNDRYTDVLNVEREIAGSQGLTLNGNVYLDYAVRNNAFIQLNVGIPFIVRDARPDGLTRSFIAGVEYRIKF